MNLMDSSLQHLLWYADEGEDMLNRIATGDELQNRIREYFNAMEISEFTFNQYSISWEFMLIMFWDPQGVPLADFQKRIETVNSASYCEVPSKLPDAIRRKHPGQLARVPLHHHDPRPHTARATQKIIQNYNGNFLNIHLIALLGPY
jgi:hypothetical protein